MLEKEIKLLFKGTHDRLSKNFYARKRSPEGVTPEEQEAFNSLHAQNWADMKAQLSAEGYIHPPQPTEIDKIKERLDTLEKKEVLL